jgi:dTDP-4-dehydrorhamnose 3,5-epimerase
MKFTEIGFQGCYLIEIDKTSDVRGNFFRTWDKEEFFKNKICSDFVQSNISFNKKKGTIRGIHFQEYPFEEGKLVKCIKGKIFEVFIDLRKNSKTYKQWESIELDSKENFELFIPKGIALGMQTLEDNSEIFYQISQYYKSEFSKSIRWNDPIFKIKWPLQPTVISEKDKNCKNFIE